MIFLSTYIPAHLKKYNSNYRKPVYFIDVLIEPFAVQCLTRFVIQYYDHWRHYNRKTITETIITVGHFSIK